jgi:hypothetical protein
VLLKGIANMGKTNYLPLSIFCTQPFSLVESTEAEFLDEIQTKVLRVFLLVITVNSTALPWNFYFIKLTQPLPVSRVQLVYFTLLRRKEENLI